MTRSFTDRVLGGVCGGLAIMLPFNAWTIRLLFVILTPLTLGLAAMLYIVMWWLLPQESLISTRRSGVFSVLLLFLAVAAIIFVGVGSQAGWLVNDAGESLVLPALFVVMSSAYFLRQLRG